MKIKSLEGLRRAALRRKSVVTSWGRVMPAAFVINWQGMDILKQIKRGLTIYEKPNKNQRRNRHE